MKDGEDLGQLKSCCYFETIKQIVCVLKEGQDGESGLPLTSAFCVGSQERKERVII